jgi:hypothetical protein
MRSGAATKKRTRHGARRGRLTSCDAAPNRGAWRRQKERGVSGDAIRGVDEETKLTQTRGAAGSRAVTRDERGQGETADRERCERRCKQDRRRRKARGKRTRRRSGARPRRPTRRQPPPPSPRTPPPPPSRRRGRRSSARRSRLTRCDAAPGDGEGRQQKGRGVSGVAITRSAATRKHAKVILLRPCIHERARGAHLYSASASSTTSPSSSKSQGWRWATVSKGARAKED